MGARRGTLAERLWARVDRTGGPAECWPWRGCVQKHSKRHNLGGYGKIKLEPGSRRTTYVHRAALIVSGLEIPEGFEAHHRPTCPRTCCNPAHLSAIPASENRAEALQRRHASRRTD